MKCLVKNANGNLSVASPTYQYLSRLKFDERIEIARAFYDISIASKIANSLRAEASRQLIRMLNFELEEHGVLTYQALSCVLQIDLPLELGCP